MVEEEEDAGAARSIVTGKLIKRSAGSVADAEGEARRQALLAHMNEGEGVAWGGAGPAVARPGAGRRVDELELARSDPQKMRELLERGHAAQREREQRLGRLASGVRQEDYSLMASSAPARPRNYKQERLQRERGGD